jgi:hypothetical protein
MDDHVLIRLDVLAGLRCISTFAFFGTEQLFPSFFLVSAFERQKVIIDVEVSTSGPEFGTVGRINWDS